MMKSNLVFIPYPGIGHLRSAVEMAKLLVEQETTLSVSLLILPFVSHDEAAASAYVASHFAASTDRLNYELITNKDQPNDEPVRVDMHVENQISKVRQAVAKLVHDKSTRVAGFVVDMFCANDLNVPTYLFYTSNAGALALGFHVQKLYDENKYHVITESDIENSEAELVVPFFTRPYPVKCLPSGLASEVWFQIFVNQARRFRETKGILVNTVAELEPYALESLLRCGDTPRVYPVGPLLHVEKQAHASMDEKESEILEWLDEQPAKSVVFLCFGSLGSFSEEQAREIALALERSGHSFVWSLRRASSDTLKENPKQYTNLEEVLPEGFLHRTMDRGRMIGWALQIAVLEKPAIGGFVTHCGWNSTLESL
ncbi:unnamed protein product [Cochlearia groenlandica]